VLALVHRAMSSGDLEAIRALPPWRYFSGPSLAALVETSSHSAVCR
jgi:hypothetical protein